MSPLKLLAVGILTALLTSVLPVAGQSLSPIEKAGTTPSLRKAFRLQVGNPYSRRMTFVLVPMQPDYATPAKGASLTAKRLTLAPGFSRQVIFTFDIDQKLRERTIALCVMPENLDGPILPRVCGLYTGRVIGTGG